MRELEEAKGDLSKSSKTHVKGKDIGMVEKETLCGNG